MVISLNSKPIATGYTPEALPPVAILRDWLKLSGSQMSAAELQAALGTGQGFELAAGCWINWSIEQ